MDWLRVYSRIKLELSSLSTLNSTKLFPLEIGGQSTVMAETRSDVENCINVLRSTLNFFTHGLIYVHNLQISLRLEGKLEKRSGYTSLTEHCASISKYCHLCTCEIVVWELCDLDRCHPKTTNVVTCFAGTNTCHKPCWHGNEENIVQVS